jgi:uncharacterized membrane protein
MADLSQPRLGGFEMKLGLDIALLVLSLLGLLLSLYMTLIFVRVQRGEQVKCFDGACPIVMKTTYAQSLGFPNSYLAIPFYAALSIYAAMRLAGQMEWMFMPVVITSAGSVLMSAYLVYALLVKLKRP